MLKNESLWKAIDRLARTNHFSCSGMARAAGLDPTTFNRSKRASKYGQPRWLSMETIAKILYVTHTSFAQFAEYLDNIDNGTER